MQRIANREQQDLIDLVIGSARLANFTTHERRVIHGALAAVVMGNDLSQFPVPVRMYAKCIFTDRPRNEALNRCPIEFKADCQRLFSSIGFECFETIFHNAPHWVEEPLEFFESLTYEYRRSRQRTGFKPVQSVSKSQKQRHSEKLPALEPVVPASSNQQSNQFLNTLRLRLHHADLSRDASKIILRTVTRRVNGNSQASCRKHLAFFVDYLMAGKTKKETIALSQPYKTSKWKKLQGVPQRLSLKGLRVDSDWILNDSRLLFRKTVSYDTDHHPNSTVNSDEGNDDVFGGVAIDESSVDEKAAKESSATQEGGVVKRHDLVDTSLKGWEV